MSDQAEGLRRIMQMRSRDLAETRTQDRRANVAHLPLVYTVASGKGGVGKSCFVANLGSMLAREGHRVLLIDGDFGLANLDMLLGVQSSITLEQILAGKALIQNAIIGVEQNLWLLPAAAGLSDIKDTTSRATSAERTHFISLMEQVPWEMDFIFIDAGSGIQNNVLSLHSPTFQSLIVLTPEPTSFTDAYGMIKILRRDVGITKTGIIVNQVTDGREGQQCFQKLRDVATRFVDVQFEYMGHWTHDKNITQSVMKRKILLDLDEKAPSIGSLQLIAKRFAEKSIERKGFSRSISSESGLPTGCRAGNTSAFWRTLLGEVKA